jgi:hypothetical protein
MRREREGFMRGRGDSEREFLFLPCDLLSIPCKSIASTERERERESEFEL